MKPRTALRAILPVLAVLSAGLGVVATPAQAQFSQGYKFLDAIRKKDGNAVQEALSEPGSTLINSRDVTSGETALHIVTQRRDLTWMSYLIGKGANVNARDGKGMTPMQIASNLGFLEGVELLVTHKADVDQPNDAGETPLIFAVHRRDLAMVRALIKGGANPDRADNSGRSARDYAQLDGRNSPLVAAIEAEVRTGGQSAKSVYGPTF